MKSEEIKVAYHFADVSKMIKTETCATVGTRVEKYSIVPCVSIVPKIKTKPKL